MALPSVYDIATVKKLEERLEKLTHNTVPKWGTMNAPKMLAHVNVPYHLAFGVIENKNNFFMKLILKWFVKEGVVNEVPYKENLRTAPVFIIADERDFEKEKQILVDYLYKVHELGASFFEGKESASFGKLSATEWNNMFYKHLDHHFRQFGV